MGALVGWLALAGAPVRAQEGGIFVEGGAARALPPSGVAAETATYGVGGLRVEWSGPAGAVLAAAYGGMAAGDAGSDFASGALGGELWLVRGGPVGLGLAGMVQGFAVEKPLFYRVTAMEVSPMVRFGGAAAPLVIRGRFGSGSTRVELHRREGIVRRAEHDLWTAGVDAEVRLAAASGQQPTGVEWARATLTPEVFRQVEEITAAAARSGLPVEPLWDKALEGAAKRVPAQRIAPAVSEYVGRLTAARGALGAGQTASALVAGADALRRGVPAEALARVGQGGRASMALVVLADLIETGVPVDRAMDVVREALDRRTADEDMLGLSGRVRAAMREGRTPVAAADELRRAIREGRVRRMPAGGGRVGPPAAHGSEPITRDPPARPRGRG